MVIPLVLAAVALVMAARALQDQAWMTGRLDRMCGATFASSIGAVHDRLLVEARLKQITNGSSRVRRPVPRGSRPDGSYDVAVPRTSQPWSSVEIRPVSSLEPVPA